MDGTGDFENWRSAFEHLVAIATQTKCDAEIEIQDLGSSPNKLLCCSGLGLKSSYDFQNTDLVLLVCSRTAREQSAHAIHRGAPAGNRRSASPRPGLRYIAGTDRAGDQTMRKRRSAEAPVDGTCRPREPCRVRFSHNQMRERVLTHYPAWAPLGPKPNGKTARDIQHRKTLTAEQSENGDTCEISHRLSSPIHGKPIPLPNLVVVGTTAEADIQVQSFLLDRRPIARLGDFGRSVRAIDRALAVTRRRLPSCPSCSLDMEERNTS